MADKAVSELVAAEQITATDLFVLEQNGTAKKLTGQILLNWLTAAADGHGGISDLSKVSTSGLTDTYRITLADTTIFDFVVTNGKGVSSIKKTSTSGLVDTYTISYNDGTSGTFTVTNGAKGDKGDAMYLWVKYASQEPTENSHSFGDVPDNWIGIYSGTSATAPTDWAQYQWFEIKGKQGNTGAPATLVSFVTEYLVSDSGTVVPSGSWTTTIPTVAQGKYLWTRTTQTFNTGDPVVSYSISRMGIDGLGSVQSVAGLSPNSDGNVELKPSTIGAVATDGSSTMTGALKMGGNKITNVAEPEDETDGVNKSYVDALIYPVGSIYLSVNETSPASLFGGTWEQLKDRFLLGAGDTYAAGGTGGAATVTLTTSQMPKHTHDLVTASGYNTGTTSTNQLALGKAAGTGSDEKIYENDNAINSAGGGAAHNNMPPYLAVYMWKRVA